jgi:hypothetical protein
MAGDLEAAGWPRAVEGARTLINLIRGYELECLLDPQRDPADFGRRLEWVLIRPDENVNEGRRDSTSTGRRRRDSQADP